MSKINKDLRRKVRNRIKLKAVSGDANRLAVHRSNNNIYAQVIEANTSNILASASTLDKEFDKKAKTAGNSEAAALVGKLIAQKAIKLGLDKKKMVFDRSSYLYHGRVKALAEAAREAGLKF